MHRSTEKKKEIHERRRGYIHCGSIECRLDGANVFTVLWWNTSFKTHAWEIFQTQSLSNHETHEVHLDAENTTTAANIFQVVKELKAGKDAGYNISDLRCSKPWIELLFFTFLVCVTCPGVLEWHRKIDKLGWSSPYVKRETAVNALSAGTLPSLTSLKKCMTSVLQMMSRP